MTATAPGTARELRQATRGDHASAEHSPFMTALLGGLLSPEAYVDLLVQLHAVYRALEATGERFADDPVAGGFVDPALHRVPAIERDLVHLAGAGWADQASVSDAAARYAAHVLGCDDPATFVAHHYTRYLGDLSGGQVIGRIVRTAYGLDEGGASFYAFDGIGDPKSYKEAYRARLDAAGLDATALADEVTLAYGFNAAVFAALAQRHLTP